MKYPIYRGENSMSLRRIASPGLCFALACLALGWASAPLRAINPVIPPSFPLPNVAFYCAAIWPNAGGGLSEGAQGDYNSSPCAQFPGANVKRTGMLTNDFWNIAEEWCDWNYYWIYQTWGGNGALTLAFNSAAGTQTHGNCYSQVTIGGALRGNEDTIGAMSYWSDPANSSSIPVPAAYDHTGKTFNAKFFTGQIMAELQKSPPTGYTQPIGYQLSVRAPLTDPSPAPLNSGVLVDFPFGNVVGNKPLPSGGYPNPNGFPFNFKNYPGTSDGTSSTDMGNPLMDVNRRFDSASIAKTITAVAVMAAFEDLAEHNNPRQVTLESSINPYLQMIWPGGVDLSLQPITFRDLLQHTTPLCKNPLFGGDRYDALKKLMAQPPPPGGYGAWQPGPTEAQPGLLDYCDNNYALLRILLPVVVEGPGAFRNPNGTLKSDAEIDELTAVSYRNYARSKIFAPIGLPDVDVFYKGALPETIYFFGNILYGKPSPAAGVAIPDQINVGVGANVGYDLRPDTTLRSAGSGFWYLSAKEYSLFIANLWAGRIIPLPAVQKMLTVYPLGIELSSITANNKVMTTFGKNGGGGWGGPATQWVTFPDGYTAVLLANSFAGEISFRAMLEKWYDAAWQ
jgi:CubicO group peptidase (beta-lactamase class C family)